jgi:hypothetical protein
LLFKLSFPEKIISGPVINMYVLKSIFYFFPHNVKQAIEFLYVLYKARPTMHLALACAIRARRELYVYYISDVKFLG